MSRFEWDLVRSGIPAGPPRSGRLPRDVGGPGPV